MLNMVSYQGNPEKVWVVKEKSEALLSRRLDCQLMAGNLLGILHILRIKNVYSEFVNPKCKQDLGDDLQDAID